MSQLNKFFISFIFLLISTQSFADALAPGYSYISITNNTARSLHTQTMLFTKDLDFKKGSDWDDNPITLEPYETKEVLWFSRNIHLKTDELYQFNLNVTPLNPLDLPVQFSFFVTGQATLGSDIKMYLTMPFKPQKRILLERGLETYSGDFWKGQHYIYARNHLVTANFFSSFHFVIDEPQSLQNPTPPQTLDVLSYNTQLMPFYTRVVNKLNHPGTRANDIPDKISSFDAVILEELFDRDLRNQITNKMKLQYPYFTNVAGNMPSKLLTGGVMIFSKWPILEERQITYSSGNGFDDFAAKGVSYAKINKAGMIYHIFGTHLQANNKPEDRAARFLQIYELNNFINAISIPKNEPVILGGDFNTDEFAEDITILKHNLSVTIEKNIGYRYSIDPSINSMSTSKVKSRLDYIFYRTDHLKPKTVWNKVWILRDLDNLSMWPDFDLSDHFPVAGHFEFEKR